jgi:hypothetical protein
MDHGDLDPWTCGVCASGMGWCMGHARSSSASLLVLQTIYKSTCVRRRSSKSGVADNKTFCVYLAKDEAIIRKHAEISGFPATTITEVRKMIDPTTAAS